MIPQRSVFVRAACAITLATTLATTAQSAAVTEIEPNDTLATAQMIVNRDPTIQIDGDRTFANPSDDFYAFRVYRGGLLSITSSSPDFFADSIMGLFKPNGDLVASNDDGAGSFMSSLSYMVDELDVGIFRLGFSGYNPGLLACTATVTECYDTDGDFVFDTFVAGGGSGGSTGWGYRIDIAGPGLVSTPSTLALLALSLPFLVVKRRRDKGSATAAP